MAMAKDMQREVGDMHVIMEEQYEYQVSSINVGARPLMMSPVSVYFSDRDDFQALGSELQR